MRDNDNRPIFPLAYDIKSLVEASKIGRSTIYEDMAAGQLKARKAGRRTVFLHEDAVAWLQSLPVREPSSKASQT